MSQSIPPTLAPMASMGRPHRGTMILVLGILALVFDLGCGLGWILGIFSWVMGNTDLREMDAGRMDPSGRGLTQAGKICGMVSIGLAIIGILFYVLLVVVIGVGAAAAAAGQHP